MEVLNAALPGSGFQVDSVTLNLVTSDLSIEAERESVAAIISYEIWDKETPINGVPAEKILQRSDYAGGEVYLIYLDGVVGFLQPHHPSEGIHPMTTEDAIRAATEQVEGLVSERSELNLVTKVIERLTAAGFEQQASTLPPLDPTMGPDALVSREPLRGL
jgi:hypothetical protein